MIESLRIRDLAVVKEAAVDFVPGLNVLTGETGAGKSLVLGALALLSGARASADVVRAGAAGASVEAIVSTADSPEFERDLKAQGYAVEDHTVVVSRRVESGGRSRAQIGGRWVPISALRELLDGRLEISSQHASQALRRPEDHADFLDDFGSLDVISKKLRDAYQSLREDLETLRTLRSEQAERERQRDFLKFQSEEIDAAALEDGEIASLGHEQRRLAHAEELGAGLVGAAGSLSSEEPDNPGALEAVERALTAVEPLLPLDPALASSFERLRGLREEVADLAIEFSRVADRIDVDPARLESVETRIAVVETLRRKYGKDETEIAAYRDRLGTDLRRIGDDSERAEGLDAACVANAEALGALATELSASRRAAAAGLEEAVDTALGRLEMEGARFSVAFTPTRRADGLPCGPRGAENVEFQLASNPGEPARPLAKVASGGELSRVFLALKNARLRGNEVGGRTLIFAEVDAGIGGQAIDQVGLLLSELGARHQVLCITHWPQIAAAAGAHHRVRKRRQAGRNHTVVEALDDSQRVDELARMAGGAKVSEATRRHAQDLLKKRGGTRVKTARSARSAKTPRGPRSRPPL